MRTRPCLCTLFLALGGCAGVPRAARDTCQFPRTFQATQLVRLTQPPGDVRELLASVRRSGGDYDVTLFDPVFAFAMITASIREGTASEEALVPDARPGDGKRLVSLLRDLYGRLYSASEGGIAEASAATASYRLTGVPGAGTACRFPTVIEITPRLGPGPRVQVRTVDVSCSPSPPGS